MHKGMFTNGYMSDIDSNVDSNLDIFQAENY